MQSWPLSGLRYAYARANTARQLASMYALRCTRATCSRRVSHRDGSDPSVRPSDPAPRPIRTYLRVWLGVGHSDTIYDRERPVRVDRIRMGYASDPSAPLRAGSEAIRPSILQRTGKRPLAPGRRRSNRDGGQIAGACRRDDDDSGRVVNLYEDLMFLLQYFKCV